jgi:hypothetical protein
MLKEMCIIFALMGCILLMAPMSQWLFYCGFPIVNVKNLPIYFALPLIIAVYAIYDIKMLNEDEKYLRATYFGISLILAFMFSFLLLLAIFPYFKPNLIF